MVHFEDGVNSINGCSVVAINSSLQATCQTSTLGTGMHSISAVLASDLNFNSSTSNTLSQTINAAAKLNTTTALRRPVAKAPSLWGQTVTFTATVSSTSGTPTGSVQFEVDGVSSGSPVALSGGQAQLMTNALAIKASPGHIIRAVYSGDASYNGSTSTSSARSSRRRQRRSA